MLSFLKPLSWTFPAIYSLPENCLEMISSPLPIICGINTSFDLAMNRIIPEYTDSEDVIYVFLDLDFILCSSETVNSVKVPSFDGFFKSCKERFGELFLKEKSISLEFDFGNLKFKQNSKSAKLVEKKVKRLKHHKEDEKVRKGLSEKLFFEFLREMRNLVVKRFIDVLPESSCDHETSVYLCVLILGF